LRRSREDTARARQEIVEAASRLFREKGIPAVSVADVMGSLGRTVGGFYRHFESKDALVAEAIELASVATTGFMGNRADAVEGYLSEGHRADRANGCPVAAFCAEIMHEGKEPRAAFDAALGRLLQVVARVQPGDRSGQLASAATAVGALVLSRASTDEKLGREILGAARDTLKTTRRRRAR
jgi:TetR/AcrR family transcriptional repressor of nem operon